MGYSLWWLFLLQRAQGLSGLVMAHGFSCPRACRSFQTKHWTPVLCIGRQILNYWTTRKAPVKLLFLLFNLLLFSAVILILTCHPVKSKLPWKVESYRKQFSLSLLTTKICFVRTSYKQFLHVQKCFSYVWALCTCVIVHAEREKCLIPFLVFNSIKFILNCLFHTVLTKY